MSFTVDSRRDRDFISGIRIWKSTTAQRIARLLPEGATVTGRIMFDDRDVSPSAPAMNSTDSAMSSTSALLFPQDPPLRGSTRLAVPCA